MIPTFLLSSESSSSDDELYALFYKEKESDVEDEDFLEDTSPQYSDTQFIEQFRISRQVVKYITEKFSASKYFNYQRGPFGKLDADAYILIFLWFAGHETASYREVSSHFNISVGTLRKVIEKVIYFLSNLSVDVIKWPTPEEQLYIKDQLATYGFHDVVGIIAGSHIRIDKPSEDPDSYLNKENHYTMQIVCDHRGKICDLSTGYPGSVDNNTAFRASSLPAKLTDKCGDNYILALDDGFPIEDLEQVPQHLPPNYNSESPEDKRDGITRRQDITNTLPFN
ncbi:hypothetical protein GWI33_006093 [Rhynchophorus ferrugineus]|uniref:DDE Tnp4 domain-containing protein n=1 Tax=Rhynchophorus ferrugineus TaxID=354439 RepID=A0A834IGK7_RHYFE|nr:hypothetical protein GWI33_006093 [Rhynchophorus ferrugineus]